MRHKGVAVVGDLRTGFAATTIAAGTTIIPRPFTNADHFWRGLARVAWDDGYGYIDKRVALYGGCGGEHVVRRALAMFDRR